MKINKSFFLGLCILLAAVSASCNKSEGGDPASSGVKLLPCRITITATANYPQFSGSETILLIEYDDQNRVLYTTERTRFFLYDPGWPTLITKFTYEGSVITTTASHDESKPWMSTVRSYVLKNEGSQTFVDYHQRIEVDGELRVISAPQEFFSYDGKGNLANITQGEDEQQQTICEFTYDDKNGIFRYVNMPPWFMVTRAALGDTGCLNMANNCLKAKENGVVVYEYENTYNSDNYPVKILRKPIGIDENESFSYRIEYVSAH